MLQQKGDLMSRVSKEVQKLGCFQVWFDAEAQMVSSGFLVLWVCLVPFTGWVSLLVAAWLHLHVVLQLHTFKPQWEKVPQLPEASVEVSWGLSDSERSLCPILNQLLFIQEKARLWLARPQSHAMTRSAPKTTQIGGGGWGWRLGRGRLFKQKFWTFLGILVRGPSKSKFPLSNA